MDFFRIAMPICLALAENVTDACLDFAFQPFMVHA